MHDPLSGGGISIGWPPNVKDILQFELHCLLQSNRKTLVRSSPESSLLSRRLDSRSCRLTAASNRDSHSAGLPSACLSSSRSHSHSRQFCGLGGEETLLARTRRRVAQIVPPDRTK